MNTSGLGFEMFFRRGVWRTDDPAHQKKEVDRLEELMLQGKYMAVKIERILVNVRVREVVFEKRVNIHCAVLIQFFNLWDWRLRTFGSDAPVKIVDSEGFQHVAGECPNNMELPDFYELGAPLRLHWPDLDLESKARTRGWLLFDELPPNVLPQRFIFMFNVFDAGNTAGWVRDHETLEFSIRSYELHTVKQLSPGGSGTDRLQAA